MDGYMGIGQVSSPSHPSSTSATVPKTSGGADGELPSPLVQLPHGVPGGVHTGPDGKPVVNSNGNI